MGDSEKPKCITVYASSSDAVNQSFKDDAYALGKAIAEAGMVQCNGGGRYGLMGAATDGGLENGGVVDCVILRMFVDHNLHPGFRNTIVSESMSERKAGLIEHGDAFIALPGGLGTLEELAEIASWRQLEILDKPLILLNTNGFYTDFWSFYKKAMQAKFISERCDSAIFLASSVPEALRLVEEYKHAPITKAGDLARADWTLKDNSE